MSQGLAAALPLSVDEVDGCYKLIKTYSELVKQNFKVLLMTNPGERLMDSNFGVGLRRKLFENNSPTTYADISSDINEQVSKYMPFLQINDIDFGDSSSDSNFLSIRIAYTIVPLSVSDILEETIPIDSST
jgi:uncharacterized protein